MRGFHFVKIFFYFLSKLKMNTHVSDFLGLFDQNELEKAHEHFLKCDADTQRHMLAALFQRSANAKTPFLVSVLRRKLHAGEHFQDFYQSWLPDDTACNPTVIGGQTYQQHFPVSTRVLNATNLSNGQEVISVGITWVKSEAEKNGILAHIEKAKKGDDVQNQKRQDKIQAVADGELLGLFEVKSDDNLGVPF